MNHYRSRLINFTEVLADDTVELVQDYLLDGTPIVIDFKKNS